MRIHRVGSCGPDPAVLRAPVPERAATVARTIHDLCGFMAALQRASVTLQASAAAQIMLPFLGFGEATIDVLHDCSQSLRERPTRGHEPRHGALERKLELRLRPDPPQSTFRCKLLVDGGARTGEHAPYRNAQDGSLSIHRPTTTHN